MKDIIGQHLGHLGTWIERGIGLSIGHDIEHALFKSLGLGGMLIFVGIGAVAYFGYFKKK